MYIYTVIVACLFNILDFFFSLLSLPLTLTSLFFSFPLSAHSYRSTLSHAIKSTLSFHQNTSLSLTHVVDSSPITDLLWIRSTLSDHGCWFSLDCRLGCGGLFLLIANLFFFFIFFFCTWGCHDSDCGCGSVGCRFFFWIVFSSFLVFLLFFFFGLMLVLIWLLSGRPEAGLMMVVAWW